MKLSQAIPTTSQFSITWRISKLARGSIVCILETIIISYTHGAMSEAVNYCFGEAPVEASVSSQRATPAELVAMANNIWRKVTKSGIDEKDTKGTDRLLEELQAEFKDFNTSFPLVLRWMVQLRQYKPKAFEKYLLKHSSAKLDTRKGFLELQAEYPVLLYRETHKHPDENFVRRYREHLVQQLLDEDKVFMEMQKKVEKDLEQEAAEMDRDRRQKLYEYVLAQRVDRERRIANQIDAANCKGDAPASRET